MKQFTVILLLFVLSTAARATVALPDLFLEHAVLQKSERTSVWGSATPGEKVSVALGSSPAKETVADEAGKWQVQMDLHDSTPGPFDLSVSGSGAPLVIHDVVVGDVWICSGQSNMEFKLSQSIGGAEETAKSDNPLLRYFVPVRQAVAAPAENLHGQWIVAGPATSGRFSAVGYYFGKMVQASQKIPIGLIDTSWGGTPAEAWISSQGLDRNPELKPGKDAVLAERPLSEEKLKHFAENFKSWAAQYQREDHPSGDPAGFAAPDVSTADWKEINLPGPLAKAGLPDSGVVWLRRELDLPPNRANTYLPLLLGTPCDFETVYWNGMQIGETTPAASTSLNPDMAATMNRRYDVPGNLVKPGRNTLAIRLCSPAGDAGLEASRFTAGWSIPLSGPWKAKVEYELPALPAEAKSSYPRRPPWPVMPHYTATYLFNGMTYPLLKLSVRGVTWYQGEANTGRAHQYRDTFPLLIQDWREQFQRKDLPFYFCQLANYMVKKSEPGESTWAELRDAQTQTLSLPNTGMAVLIDIGEEDDIHFRNKKDAGERLGAVALAKTYGQDIAYSSPVYQSLTIEGDKVRIHFSHSDKGLVAKTLPATYQPKSSLPATKPLILNSADSELQGFAVCGEDRHWKWAKAKIEGDTVVVQSAEIPAPKFIRYAWADNPTCNLYNGAGLPAVPFRTDDFPESTVNSKF